MFQKGFPRVFTIAIPLKSCYSQANSGISGVRVKAKVSLSLCLLFFTLAAYSSQGQIAPAQPVTTTQLVAWLTGGVPSIRLTQLVRDGRLANLPTHAELR